MPVRPSFTFRVLLLFLLVLGLPATARATSIQIAPIVDGTMAVFATDPFSISISINTGSILLVTGRVSNTTNNAAILEFPLSGIPSGATITSASLWIVPTGPGPVHILSGHAGDGVITANDRTAGSFLAAFTPGVGSPVAEPVAFLQSLVDSSAGFASFRLEHQELQTFLFHSSEADPALRPSLQVSYVPEPTTFALLGFALLMRTAWRRAG